MSYSILPPTPSQATLPPVGYDRGDSGFPKPLVIPQFTPEPRRMSSVSEGPPPLMPLGQDQLITSKSFSDLVRQVQHIQEQLNVLQANQNLSRSQQITNPIQYLSPSGIGQMLSTFFGGRRQMQAGGNALTDSEQDIRDEHYFEDVEAPKVFNVKRVEKTSRSQLS
ncbi:MAG: hypothetical protein HEQ32_02455 [Vampirovibrio sp.]